MTIHQDKIDAIIKKAKLAMRTILILSICFSFLLLLLISVDVFLNSSHGHREDFIINLYVDSIIAYGAFYSFIFGTIPAAVCLTIIFGYNKFNNRPNWPLIKTETILLVSNLLLLTFAFITIMLTWKEDCV